MKPNVINFHITDKCNYRCRYCFAKFPGKELSLEGAKRVVDKVKEYFLKYRIEGGRINIAGGESMLYPYIEEMIRYIHGQGIRCSMITNGSRLTADFCERMAGKLDMIGISIDAATAEGNARIGRCNCKETPNFEELEKAAAMMRRCGIRLKINTVVSKLNLDEDLASVYRRLNPDKVKMFCMHVVENANGGARALMPTEEEYAGFVAKNRVGGCQVVVEGHESMQNAYFMINPQGEVYMNDGGIEKKYGSCLATSLIDIFQTIPLCEKKYFARYSEGRG